MRIEGDALMLEGVVTMRTAPSLSRSAGACLATAKPLRIDLSRVTELDSTAVALVLQVARELGTALPIVGAPAGFSKLAALYGVDSLLAPAA